MGVQAIKMIKLQSILKKTIFIFLVVVIFISLYLIAVQVISKEEVPKVFGFSKVVVVSGSMYPAIEVGDLLVIKEQAEYQVNDIVTYRSGSSLVTHRVETIEGKTLVTKGDANNVADEMIELSQVEGKMLLRIPQMGRFIMFLKTPLGIVLILLAGVLLFIIPLLAEKRK